MNEEVKLEQGEFTEEELENVMGGQTFATQEDYEAYQAFIGGLKGYQEENTVEQELDPDELTVEELDQITAGVPGRTL